MTTHSGSISSHDDEEKQIDTPSVVESSIDKEPINAPDDAAPGPVALAFAESAQRARDSPGFPRTDTRQSRQSVSGTTRLPRTRTQNSQAIVAFRTLSIGVHDTQQQRKLGRTAKKDASAAETDYFASLDYHTSSAKAVCDTFNVHPESGLDSSVAKRRLETSGPNVLVAKRPNYLWKLFKYLFGQFCTVLWVGVIIFFISWKPLGNPPAAYNLAIAIFIIVVILLQAGFNALQDFSTARVMNSITGLLPSNAVVIRDGEKKTIPAADIVTGDLIVLTQGIRVPADIRLISASDDLTFDRAILTGESEEVPAMLDDTETNFLESKAVGFLGSFVASGTGLGVVVLTGSKTVMGRINKLTNTGKEKTTGLQREINRFVIIIVGMTITLVLIMLIFWLAYLRPHKPGFLNVVGILTNLMSLVVAFIPEGMPMAVTLTLTMVAKRMKDVNVLPKSLSTVETLGCVTMLLSDKTGTLTMNQMTVNSVYCDGRVFSAETPKDHPDKTTETYKRLEKAMILCNGAFFETKEDSDEQVPKGNATDIAVLKYVAPSGEYRSTIGSVVKSSEIPFNSKIKYMSTSFTDGKTGKLITHYKGGPDVLLPKCALSEGMRRDIINAQEQMASEGQRTILLAEKPTTVNVAPTEEDFAKTDDLQFLGLLGIVDPPRPEIPGTVTDVRRSGSRFHMVTGDFVTTAVAIARQCKIITVEKVARVADIPASTVPGFEPPYALAVEGKEIPTLTQAQWDVIMQVEEVVFARTTPEQKLGIVREARERDFTVAVTGDGTNDAPAMKAADVGIAMSTGSDVALEAADLVLMGSFASIVDGIRNGRLVFQNLQKVISYLLPAGSFSEDVPVVLNVFLGVPLPLSSFLMIIICTLTDLASCLTLIMEKEEFDLLSLPPRSAKKDHLVGPRLYSQSYLFIGVMETICAHSMFFLYMWQDAKISIKDLFLVYENWGEGYHGYTADELTAFLNRGQCVYFVSLVVIQIFNLMSVRSKRMSLLQANPLVQPRRNLWLFVGPIFSISIALIITLVPGIQNLFGTASVPVRFWFIPAALGLGVLMMDELRKLLVRTFPKGPVAKIAW